jgi:hypothetical protein
MDATAYNYDPTATVDDGSCWYAYGCTDPTASNYDATAVVDDGTCITCGMDGGYAYVSIPGGWVAPTGFGSNDGSITFSIVAGYDLVAAGAVLVVGFSPLNANGINYLSFTSSYVFSTTYINNDTVTYTITNVGNVGCTTLSVIDVSFPNNCELYSNDITSNVWPCAYEGWYFVDTPNNSGVNSCQELTQANGQAQPAPPAYTGACDCCQSQIPGQQLFYDPLDIEDGTPGDGDYIMGCTQGNPGYGCGGP